MSILGNLIVSLSANTASFIEGMTGASKTARTVGHEIESSFSSLGHVAASAFAPFGEMGAAVGETLGKIGEMSGIAIQSIGKLSGGTGALAVGLGTIAGAAAAVTAGVVGLAVHTAMAQAELGEMSQKTGVSTQTLAGLGLAARETGVPMGSLAKALEFMNSNAVKAAIGSKGGATAFSRLGVEVTDATGKMRDSTETFLALFAKISELPQPEQGYFTKAIFGKGGAEILPLLNLTQERMTELVKLAMDLDLGNPQTVAASQKFKETVEDVKAEFEGMAILLTKNMLPALQFIARKIEEAFASGSMQKFIGQLAWIAKETIVLGNELFQVFVQIGILFEGIGGAIIAVFVGIGTVIEATARAAVGDFTGAWAALQAGAGQFKSVWTDVSGAMKKSFADQKAFKDGIWSQQGALPPPRPHKGTANLEREHGDTTLGRIQERIAALAQEAKDWANLASAGSQAEALIAEAIKKGNAEFGKLKAEAAKDKTGAALPFVMQNEDAIKAAGAESVFGAAIRTLTGDLDKQKEKLGEEGKAALALGAAYQQGGAAIAAAAIDQKFAEQASKVNVLAEVHDRLAQQWGKDNPIVLQLADSVARLTQTLEANKTAAAANLSQTLTNELTKQNQALALARPYVDALNAAYFKSEDAIRAARIELELYQWEQDQLNKGIAVSQAQIAQKRSLLTEADREAYESSIQQSAAQFDLNRMYDEQIVKLQRVREALQTNGSSTLLVDARLFSVQQQLIKQWDDAAFAVGTFGQKSRAVFNEMILQGQDAGKKIAEAFLSAYDSLTGALAKLATGQKANFKQIFQGLAEQVTKAEIQKGIGSLVSSLGLGKIPGLSAKADGSESNPFYVVLKNSAAGLPGGLSGPGGPLDIKNGLSWFSGLFSKHNSAPTLPSSGGSFSGLGDSFSGFFANGGNILPGHWGVTGDKGPEVVKGPATVIPMSKLGGGNQTSITNNFNGFKDNDMMRRTAAQTVAQQHRQMSIAYARS
jgi:hypothetical protein